MNFSDKTGKVLFKVVPVLIIVILILNFPLIYALNNNSELNNISINETGLNVITKINETETINQTNTTQSVNETTDTNITESVNKTEMNEINLINETKSIKKIKPDINIKNNKGSSLNARIDIISKEGNLVKRLGKGFSTLAEEEQIDEGVYDVEVIPTNHPIKKIKFSEVNLVEGTIDLGLDDVPEESIADKEFVEVYAINPANLNFTNATVTVTAKGNKLYKCKEWDFNNQICEGEWILFKNNIIPGQEYTFILTPGDPGFGEIIAIDAVHLDGNYNFISNIYDDVKALDNVWSEPIYAEEIVRVTFERNLTDGRFIDVYVRSNRTIAYFDIYEAGTEHKVGRSGITGSEQLQYMFVKNLTQPTDTFDFKVVKVVTPQEEVNECISECQTECDEEPYEGCYEECNIDCDTVTADANRTVFLEFDYIHDDYINSTQADGLVAYQETNIEAPRYRTWNESNKFSLELTDAQSVGSDITWVTVRANHERDEFIMGTIDKTDNDGTIDINIQIYTNGVGWHNLTEVSSGISVSDYRSFDIAVEDISGDALIVYENSNAADSIISYRIWNGTGYSAEQSFSTSMTASEAVWIALTPKRGADDIMMLVHNGLNELYAIPWNGTDFDSVKHINLSLGTTSITEQHFAFAWEESSGQGLAVYGETDLTYVTYSPTAPYWSTEATPTTSTGAIDAVRMCSDPTSDYIGIIWQDSGSDVNVMMWTGSVMLNTDLSNPSQDGGTQANGANNVNVDCAWENSRDIALFGFIDAADTDTMDYFNFTKTGNTWSTSDLTSTDSLTNFGALGAIRGLRFTEHPTTDEIMVVAMDNSGADQISVVLWNGSTGFSTISASPIETTTEVGAAAQEGAMFDWYRYDPVPNVTSINPSGINFDVNNRINVNATVRDNINISAVLANITLPNGTIEQLTLQNLTNDIFNVTFTTTDLTGTYIIRIIANDTSTHKNINANETATFTVGDVIKPNVTIELPASGANFNQSDNVTIRVNVTDDINVSTVLANVTLPGGSIQQLTLQNQSNNVTWEGNFTNTSTIGTYTIRIIANDTSNNINASEITTFRVGDSFAPNVTNVTPIAGTNFDLNARVNITTNVTDNVNISTVLANITLPDGSVDQITLKNSSDRMNKYNATFTNTATRGTYNITIIANDTSGNTNSSETTYFTIGDIVKPTITLNAPVAGYNTSNTTIIFNFTAKDDKSSSLNCSLVLDSVTNQTNTSTANGTATLFTVNGLANGNRKWNVTCNDSSSNTNTSETRTFTVDLDTPTFVSLTTVPSSTDDIDPNVNITALANVTDNTTSIDRVIFQWKLSSETNYTNRTMDLVGGFYNTTFNVTSEGTYNLRLFANDTVGNSGYSNLVNITVELDRTWTRTPSSFSPLTASSDTNVTLGNLTINNTGDYTLNFNITSSSSNTVLNESLNFSLAAKELKVISVNDTSPTGNLKTITLTIKATPNGNPASQTTTGTIVVAPGQPVLVATFTTPSKDTKTVTQGDRGVAFIAKLDNIGEGNASDVSLFFTIPSDWNLSYGSTNITYEDRLDSGESEEEMIEVDIPSSASTGEKNIFINATGLNASGSDLTTLNLTFGDIVIVTVNAPTGDLGAEPGTTTTTTTGGGTTGGGGGGAGAGAAAGAITVEEGEKIVQTAETFELVRGLTNSFPITINNIFDAGTLYNVTLEVEGYLSQHLQITPLLISKIEPNETKVFNVTITSATYMKQGTYPLEFTITGKLIDVKEEKIGNVTVRSYIRKNLLENRLVTLIIHEVSKAEAEKYLEQAKIDLNDMKEAGFPVVETTKLLEEAKKVLEEKNHKKVKEISQQIAEKRKNAFIAYELINDVKAKIEEIEEIGINVDEAKRLLNLASAAFEREDFETAIKRAKDANMAYLLLSKGRFNILWFLKTYWWVVLTSLILLSVSGVIMQRKLKLKLIERKIEDIDKEEVTINGLMKELQEKTFKEKSVSVTDYHKQMYNYEKRLSEIRQLRDKLRTKRAIIIKISNEIEILKKDGKDVIEKIKQLQDAYYNKQTVTNRAYTKRMEEYRLRRAEIEKSIAVLETKLAKKEKLEELKPITKTKEKLKLKPKKEKKPASKELFRPPREKPIKLIKEQIDKIEKAVEKSVKEHPSVESEIRELDKEAKAESERPILKKPLKKQLVKKATETVKIKEALTKEQIEAIEEKVEETAHKLPTVSELVQQTKEKFEPSLKKIVPTTKENIISSLKQKIGLKEPTEEKSIETKPIKKEKIKEEPTIKQSIETKPIKKEKIKEEPTIKQSIETKPIKKEKIKESTEDKPIIKKPLETKPIKKTIKNIELEEPTIKQPLETKPIKKEKIIIKPAKNLELKEQKIHKGIKEDIERLKKYGFNVKEPIIKKSIGTKPIKNELSINKEKIIIKPVKKQTYIKLFQKLKWKIHPHSKQNIIQHLKEVHSG